GAAETDVATATTTMAGSSHARLSVRTIRPLLLDRHRRVFGVLLMALEELEAGLEQRLQLAVRRRRNQRRLERAVDGLVVRHFVRNVGLVERRAAEFGQLEALIGRG